MTQTITRETLIAYLYNELTTKQRQNVETLLDSDISLKNELNNLKESLHFIEQKISQPSQQW